MPIEAFDKISNLVSAYPQGGDTKSQGDDHIRGVKQTLLNTFPDADRAFRIPRVRVLATTTVLSAADENRTLHCQTGSGNVSLSLPPGVSGVSQALRVVKASADANYVVIQPVVGLINGAFTAIYIYTLFDPHEFYWNGSAWFRLYSGVPAGSQVDFPDAITSPVGWVKMQGQTLSPSSNFPELTLARGSSTLAPVTNSIIRLC